MSSNTFDKVVIKSFNGIGDLLFVTPTLKKIKEIYPNTHITVNTNYPTLLANNPYIDKIGKENNGLFLGYPDPIHAVNPTMHHIQFDYRIIKKFYRLKKLPSFLTDEEMSPEIYLNKSKEKNNKIGVQVHHKGHWNKKKIWPYFSELCSQNPDIFEPILLCSSMPNLIKHISSFKEVVCAEGGISHIAKALNIPATVIYGGFAKPKWNGYKDHNNICNVLPCSYCYNPFPCVSKNRERECMHNISIEYVLGQVKK